MENVIIIGAGPCGLSTAIELKKRGIDPLIIEKGCIVNAIYHFPTHMTFFSTSELLEIGDVPFISQHDKPTRLEALKYYRHVADRYQLRIHTYEQVDRIQKVDDTKETNGTFTVFTSKEDGSTKQYTSNQLVISTGYYDNPNFLGIKGEELEKVSHYFKEAHPFYNQRVAIIGGKNSAVDAAMELEKAGAQVTVIYRGDTYSPSIKPWILPLFESLINKEKIAMYWNAEVAEITSDQLSIRQGERVIQLENDYVFALTGYRPNYRLYEEAGVNINAKTGVPQYNPETMESNVENLFISGVIAAGNNANEIFIENGRFHGMLIAKEIGNRYNKL